MIISAKLFLFLMLVMGIAVLVAAFNINSDIDKCKSLLAQKCLRGLFIMGSSMVAIPLTSFMICPNIDHIGSEFTGKILVLFMLCVGCGVVALGSIINSQCKDEKSNTMFPIILGVIITLICLVYFISSTFSLQNEQMGQQTMQSGYQPRFNLFQQRQRQQQQQGTSIPLQEPPRYKCIQRPNGSAGCEVDKFGHFSDRKVCERNCFPDVPDASQGMGTF